jgi:lipopolysaccharide/colanic/teichoic acid biosynthesis glycosyltransferase
MSHARIARTDDPGPQAPRESPKDPALGELTRRARAYARVKVCLEWLGALALLPLALPLMAALAVLLRCTSEGPALYSQMRLGRAGRPFRMYKLRTMMHGCETATGPVWSAQGDPRVTTIGRWLRATHLDELPQLWNVLRGEMSLIGPRPERPELAAVIERTLPDFRARLRVRPGITGLAQMQLPADSDLHAVRHKLASDLLYVQKLGPALDARIALATVCHLLGHIFTALSHRLVRAFAPLRHAAAPEPDYTLSIAGRRVEALRPAPPEELSKAA